MTSRTIPLARFESAPCNARATAAPAEPITAMIDAIGTPRMPTIVISIMT